MSDPIQTGLSVLGIGLAAFTLLATRERKSGGSEQELATLAKKVADHDDEIDKNSRAIADGRETAARYDERLKTIERVIDRVPTGRHRS